MYKISWILLTLILAKGRFLLLLETNTTETPTETNSIARKTLFVDEMLSQDLSLNLYTTDERMSLLVDDKLGTNEFVDIESFVRDPDLRTECALPHYHYQLPYNNAKFFHIRDDYFYIIYQLHVYGIMIEKFKNEPQGFSEYTNAGFISEVLSDYQYVKEKDTIFFVRHQNIKKNGRTSIELINESMTPFCSLEDLISIDDSTPLQSPKIIFLPSVDSFTVRLLIYRPYYLRYWIVYIDVREQSQKQCSSVVTRSHPFSKLLTIELHLNKLLIFTELERTDNDMVNHYSTSYLILTNSLTISEEYRYLSKGKLSYSEYSKYSGFPLLTFIQEEKKRLRVSQTVYDILKHRILHENSKYQNKPGIQYLEKGPDPLESFIYFISPDRAEYLIMNSVGQYNGGPVRYPSVFSSNRLSFQFLEQKIQPKFYYPISSYIVVGEYFIGALPTLMGLAVNGKQANCFLIRRRMNSPTLRINKNLKFKGDLANSYVIKLLDEETRVNKTTGKEYKFNDTQLAYNITFFRVDEVSNLMKQAKVASTDLVMRTITEDSNPKISNFIEGSYMSVKIKDYDFDSSIAPIKFSKLDTIDYYDLYSFQNYSMRIFNYLMGYSFMGGFQIHLDRFGLSQYDSMLYIHVTFDEFMGFIFLKYSNDKFYNLYGVLSNGQLVSKGAIFKDISINHLMYFQGRIYIFTEQRELISVNPKGFEFKEIRFPGKKCIDVEIMISSHFSPSFVCHVSRLEIQIYQIIELLNERLNAGLTEMEVRSPDIKLSEMGDSNLLYSTYSRDIIWIFFKDAPPGKPNLVVGRIESDLYFKLDMTITYDLRITPRRDLLDAKILDIILQEQWFLVLVEKGKVHSLIVYTFDKGNDKLSFSYVIPIDPFLVIKENVKMRQIRHSKISDLQLIMSPIFFAGIEVFPEGKGKNILLINPAEVRVSTLQMFLLPIDSSNDFLTFPTYFINEFETSTFVGIIFPNMNINGKDAMIHICEPDNPKLHYLPPNRQHFNHTTISTFTLDKMRDKTEELTFENRLGMYLSMPDKAQKTIQFTYKSKVLIHKIEPTTYAINSNNTDLFAELDMQKNKQITLAPSDYVNGTILESEVSFESQFDVISRNVKIVPIAHLVNSLEIGYYGKLEIKRQCKEINQNSCRSFYYLVQTSKEAFLIEDIHILRNITKLDSNNIKDRFTHLNTDCTEPLIFRNDYVFFCLQDYQLVATLLNRITLKMREIIVEIKILNIRSVTIERIASYFLLKVYSTDMIISYIILMPKYNTKIGDIDRFIIYSRGNVDWNKMILIDDQRKTKICIGLRSRIKFSEIYIHEINFPDTGGDLTYFDDEVQYTYTQEPDEILNHNSKVEISLFNIDEDPRHIIALYTSNPHANDTIRFFNFKAKETPTPFTLTLINPFVGLMPISSVAPICSESFCVSASIYLENSYLRFYYIPPALSKVGVNEVNIFLSKWSKSEKPEKFAKSFKYPVHPPISPYEVMNITGKIESLFLDTENQIFVKIKEQLLLYSVDYKITATLIDKISSGEITLTVKGMGSQQIIVKRKIIDPTQINTATGWASILSLVIITSMALSCAWSVRSEATTE